MPRNFAASGLARAARTAPDWVSTPDYADLAALWGDWSKGDTIDSRIALVSGSRIGVIAPALMPYPRPGWGFTSASGTIVGFANEPDSTPVVGSAGTLMPNDADMLDRVTITASGTLVRELDERTTRVLRPTFARSV